MGTKYPAGESPVYPPRDWVCPQCSHHHTKPHFAFEGQVKFGKVLKNRENKSDSCGKTGEMILKDLIQGLFCPHCGWKEEIINITKVKGLVPIKKGWLSINKLKCCIADCKKKADYTNQKLHFCKEHYEMVK